ncbi:TIGR03619 family F420-dependent LLM class oxidoreductase [Rhodococcus sp. NPDC003348]
MTALEVGLNILGAEALYGGRIQPVLDLAAHADRVGFDLISTGDHLGFNEAAHAERAAEHGFVFALDHPWYEPISLLSAVAAVTRRARLGASVLIATLRPPLLLAKQIATLDAISGGRVAIGMGVGWQEAEYAAAGVPFDARFGRMEETVAACRALWAPPPATFTGRDFAFEDFHSYPLPAQDRVPVLFGFGPSRRNFERIARVADGWTVNPTDMAAFGESVALLRECFAEHGRDPDSARIQVSVTPVHDASGAVDLDATADRALQWHKAGATVAVFRPVAFGAAAEDVPDLLDRLVGLKEEAR